MAEVINPAIVPKVTLPSGEQVPCVGMGTFGSDRVSAEDVSAAVAGAIRSHSLGCTAGGSCKPQLSAFLFKITDNRIDRCSLSGSRPAGQNEQTMTGSCRHCLFLHFI